MFQKISKGIQVRLKIISSTSKEIPGYLKKVQQVCSGSFKGVSSKFPRSCKEDSRVFQEKVNGISRKYQGKLKGV